jgi:hypothetical protein
MKRLGREILMQPANRDFFGNRDYESPGSALRHKCSGIYDNCTCTIAQIAKCVVRKLEMPSLISHDKADNIFGN